MSSEDKSRRDMERGARAAALLQNELLQEFFTRTEQELIAVWRNDTEAEDVQRREDAWRSLRLLDKLKKGLERSVVTGEFAAKELLMTQKGD